MQNPLAAVLSLRALFFLSVLLFSANVFASPGNIKIIARQNAAPLDTAQACAQYSRIANLSTIGGNTTYRTVFIDVSPVGTLFNTALLNQAQRDLPMLTMDAQLNQACGNLTALAIQEAAVNFTKGIVGQFAFTGNHASVINGPMVIGICLACLVIILGPISAL